MLNVFLTVDTEIWPFSRVWPEVPLASTRSSLTPEIGFYIYGETDTGSFGVPFQLDCLKEHGLKATYFVESLFADVAGPKPLQEIVSLVQSKGQEVQLHAHTEWLGEIHDRALPNGFRQHIRQFSQEEQAVIIGRAATNLREAGARDLCAFRAGNFGANFDTLRALRTLGIKFDSSHNACRLTTTCGLDTGHPMTQPQAIEGVHEFPLSVFRDYPGHYRPAQLCACSYGEMTEALLRAWRAGWHSFVILLHGWELLGEWKSFARIAGPNRLIVRRFTQLCRFLADNTDKFRTTSFSEIEAASIPQPTSLAPFSLGFHRTAWRIAEQLAGRLL